MKYSGTIKSFGEYIKSDTKIKTVSYQSEAETAGISAALFLTGIEKVEVKRDFRRLNVTLRVSGPADQWEGVLNVVQDIENNLQREREKDITYGEVTNPDDIDGGTGRFRLDLPIQLTESTGRTSNN